VVDRAARPDYKPALPTPAPGPAQVAQLVEHATENRSVGGSIPPLGTNDFNKLENTINFKKVMCPRCVRVTSAAFKFGVAGVSPVERVLRARGKEIEEPRASFRSAARGHASATNGR
jgi:hypothetical protein